MNRRGIILGTAGAITAAGLGIAGAVASTGSLADYNRYAADLRTPVPAAPDLMDLVRFATLAANGHNTQPWRFRLAGDSIDILPDFSRRTPVVDPDDHHLFVSLGCAAENLIIAATATGRPGELTIGADPASDGATFRFTSGPAVSGDLAAAIPARQSTRAPYDGAPVAADILTALAVAATGPGVQSTIISDRTALDRIRDLVVAGNDAQMADPAFTRELKAWLRFSPRSAATSGDGLFAAASGNPVLPDFVGGLAFDLFVTPASERDRYARQLDTASGVILFVAERADPAHWIAVGRACQRFALAATSRGLKHSFINQPVEVPELRPALAELAGYPNRRPDILMRFGHAPNLPFSPRRAVEAVLV